MAAMLLLVFTITNASGGSGYATMSTTSQLVPMTSVESCKRKAPDIVSGLKNSAHEARMEIHWSCFEN